ncbi:MAG: hypothetical protein IJM10_07345 [Clostridia bacterium]|nr:hypothetical protein [Eubacterium sp.]MBR0121585.1 hypothetical protein [Clostridia bacterium]
MITLEELYHGNINPSESESLCNNPEYKNLIALTTQSQDKVFASLNDEQKKLFDNYIINAEELSTIIEVNCFKTGFKLGARLTIEAYT